MALQRTVADIVFHVRKNQQLLTRFITSQVLIQFFNLFNGFLLLRWLSIREQAAFSIAFGLQTLLAGLSDFGFSGCIIALTGKRINDKEILGGYMASATSLRNLFFGVSLIFCAVAVPLLFKNGGVSQSVIWLCVLPIVMTAYVQADAGIYAAPLLIHNQLTSYYFPQLIGAIAKIAINYLLFITHYISASTTLLLNGLVILFISVAYKRSAAPYYKSMFSWRSLRTEMLRYLGPVMPSSLFNLVFGQVQIFIIAFFGKVQNIAEVAALGRLSQLYLVLSAFNFVITEPMIARARGETLYKKYFVVAIAATAIAFTILLASLLIPDAFLLILGNKYANLGEQVPWLLAASGVNFIATTLWTMNSARKWIFWWGTFAYIFTIILCQVAGIVTFDVSTTSGVLKLSLLTAMGILCVQISIASTGLSHEKSGISALNPIKQKA